MRELEKLEINGEYYELVDRKARNNAGTVMADWIEDNKTQIQSVVATAVQPKIDELSDAVEDLIDTLPEDFTEVEEDITQLKQNIQDIATIQISDNLLNPDNISEGWFYKPVAQSDGRYMVVKSENSAFSCAYVDVVRGQNYTATGISYNAFNGDDDGYAIGIAASASSSTANPVFDTTTTNSSYNNADKTTTRIYFSWRYATYSTDTFMFVKGTTLPSSYEEFGKSIVLGEDVSVDYNQIINTPDNNVYTVASDGSGNFTTLTQAFVALKDNEREKTIYVKSGTYDIYTEIGGDTFVNSIPSDASSYWDYVTIVPKNTSVIGIGFVRLEYLPEIDVPAIAQNFISPINISDGNVHLENIEIVCKQCRYAIHDQTRNQGNWKHTYKNVKCIKDDATSNYNGKAQAFGCGFTNGVKFDFDSCYFKSHHIPLSFHNASNAFGSIMIKNTVCEHFASSTGYKDIRFGNVSGNQVRVPVVLSNCYSSNGIQINNESSSERPNAFDILMIGCHGSTDVVCSCETNIYEAKSF